MKGKIHSIESFGTVDGPGIRCVVFFQGCSLRCRYCHNPDTWNPEWGNEVDSEDVLKKVIRFKPYFQEHGGITLSGGEPLLQPEFAAAVLRSCKNLGIHTAVDTSGWVDIPALEKVLPYTDLLLLDVKALDSTEYQWLTGQKEEKFRQALNVIKKMQQDLWLRYVVLPGINDSAQHMEKLKKLVRFLGAQVKKVEFLPYHGLGLSKWEKLGLKYSLCDLQPPSRDDIERLDQMMAPILLNNK